MPLKPYLDTTVRLIARTGRISHDTLTALPLSACHEALFWLVVLNIITLPFGRFFQTAPPVLCLLVLGLVYARDWHNTTLARCPVAPALGLFFGCIALQIVLSQHMALSFTVVSGNLYRGMALLFASLECVRSPKQARRLVVAFALVAIAQGLDGVWQHVTGFDWLRNAPLIAGRLTGSFGSYRVGDYLALVTLPAFGLVTLWHRLPPVGTWLAARPYWRAGLTCLMLSPAVFTWIFAQARSGYVALILGLYLAWCLLRRPRWKALIPLLPVTLLILFGPSRISWKTAIYDIRMIIWQDTFRLIQTHPWFGRGANAFVTAIPDLEGKTYPKILTLAHPHNIYLQWLLDGGIISFVGLSLFMLLMLAWTLHRLLKGLAAARQGTVSAETGEIWQLGVFFWCGFVGYLIIGLAGHDFYRTWFMACGLLQLGLLLSLCTNTPHDETTR